MSTQLPKSFRPIMWSYDFDGIDLKKHKKQIIVNTLNYGDLDQWYWIKQSYGDDVIKEVLREIAYTELRERVRPLIKLAFSLDDFNDSPRST